MSGVFLSMLRKTKEKIANRGHNESNIYNLCDAQYLTNPRRKPKNKDPKKQVVNLAG